ncbi:E3 ubiquitin-protein ligase arkadia-B-like [Scylla paramamosain]|uniref:E3 ubiquitin-protein ligase arkadia-B-like n=1 Tax=Scylla paramamosain TaxID=85552 RepID=UPI00308346E9
MAVRVQHLVPYSRINRKVANTLRVSFERGRFLESALLIYARLLPPQDTRSIAEALRKTSQPLTQRTQLSTEAGTGFSQHLTWSLQQKETQNRPPPPPPPPPPPLPNAVSRLECVTSLPGISPSSHTLTPSTSQHHLQYYTSEPPRSVATARRCWPSHSIPCALLSLHRLSSEGITAMVMRLLRGVAAAHRWEGRASPWRPCSVPSTTRSERERSRCGGLVAEA